MARRPRIPLKRPYHGLRDAQREPRDPGVTPPGRQLSFSLLGPLELLVDGVPVLLGGPKQRALLALLLIHTGEAVSVDRLTEGLWGEHPPRTAATSLHVYVSQLRKL